MTKRRKHPPEVRERLAETRELLRESVAEGNDALAYACRGLIGLMTHGNNSA